MAVTKSLIPRLTAVDYENEHISADDRALILDIRAAVAEHFADLNILDESPFVLLRWIRAFDRDREQIERRLIDHALLCHIFDADRLHEREFGGEALRKYDALSYLGDAGKDNRVVLVEFAGRLDPFALLKCIPASDFMLNRFSKLRLTQLRMTEIESRTAQPSGVIYIYDCNCSMLDPRLLPLMVGPMRAMWSTVHEQLPDLIDKMIVVNMPSFGRAIWMAMRPFMPARTLTKILLPTPGEDTTNTLLRYVAADRLPKHYGGQLVDVDGDDMCREWLTVPERPIPNKFYWQKTSEEPREGQMKAHYVAARRSLVTDTISTDGTPNAHLAMFFEPTRDFVLSIEVDSGKATDPESGTIYMPDMIVPAIDNASVLNRLHIPLLLANATYTIRLSNPHAWIRGTTVRFYANVIYK